MKTILLLAIASAGAYMLQDAAPPSVTEHVGKLPDGGFLLNSGWTLRPAGDQVPVDTFPMSASTAASGKYLLVLNGGYNPPTVSVIDIAAKKEVERTPVPDGWLGLTLAPRSNTLYVGGASKGSVFQLAFDPATGKLTQSRELAVPASAGPGNTAFIGDVALSPDERTLYAADLYNDSLAVIDLVTGQVTAHWKTGRRPYRILVVPGGRRLFVSSWADGAITQLDSSGNSVNVTRVAPHTTDMVLLSQPPPTEGGQSEAVARLFVTASNTNNAYSFAVARDGSTSPLETINLSLTPLHPLGMTPSALALDPSGSRLYVACSDANAVGVVDISQARSVVRGFIPTGWYPTAAVALPNNALAILNGKGLGSRANPDGPVPTQPNRPLSEGGPVVAPGYVGHIQTGTVSFLPPMADDQFSAFSDTVRRNSPYTDDILYRPTPDEQTAFFSTTENHKSPIQHVVYIIKENRTYDQVLGDMGKGDSDKSLTLFGEQVTPNLHRLARDFVLYDNFYENADVSADGHNWAAAAIAPDYTVKTWPSEYAHRKKNYDYEGGEPANLPPAGYLWTNALQAGLTVRNYGEWAENLKSATGPKQIAKVRDPSLAPYTDMNYRAFDLNYTDVDRAKEFDKEWTAFDNKGQAPNISIVRLGNDHTSGTRPGALTPLAANADNDYAVGLIAETVSHSKLWPSTAIFVIEDDAQNGPDHVDSHRAPAFVISPYTKSGTVDSRMYNQAGILRTMEMLLGLRPMTHFDAGARPLFAGFTRRPNVTPYTAVPPTISLTERNPGRGTGAKESARMDFTHEDRADDDELNAILWRAVKHTEPPAPVRSAFIRAGN